MSEEKEQVGQIEEVEIVEDFTTEELAVMHKILGQVPVAMDSEDFKKFAILRDKIARKFEAKKAQPNS